MSAITALGQGDLKTIRRDSMLLFLLLYPLILGLLLRWLVPLATTGLQETLDLRPYYVLLTSFFGLLTMTQLAGMLIGFLLLDEQDQKTLTALMVTPLPVRTYAAYRAVVPAVLCVLGSLVIVPMIGVGTIPIEALLPIAVSASVIGPIFALLLVSLAKNKVEGIALMKGLGIFLLAPFAAWWVPQPWQWLLGLFPTFWPMKAYWLAAAGESFLWVAGVGFVYGLGILLLLFRRFQRHVYRS